MFNFNKLAALQIFQLLRYAAFALIGIGFAKLSLPPTDIGHYETFIMVSGMISFFWVGGIINSMLAVYPTKPDTEKNAVILSTFISLLLFSLLAGIFLLLFSPNLLAFLHKETGGNLIVLSVIYLLLSGPAFITEFILFLNNKKTAIVVYGVISAAITVTLALMPVIFSGNVVYAMYGLIAVASLKLIFTVVVLQQYATLKTNTSLLFATLIQNLKLSAPLIASLFVSGSAEYIDGIIVKSKFDDMFFAVYRYGAKELPVLLIVANTFSTGMISSISADVETGLQELKQKSKRLMHLFFPLTIVLLPLSPYLYKYVFNDSFIYSSLIFNIYLLMAITRLLCPQTVLMGMQKPRLLLLSSVIEIVINVSVSLYLASVPEIGLPGIAIGTFVAYLFDKLFLIAVNRFVYKIAVSEYVPLIPYFVYVTATFVSFFLGLFTLKNI